MRVKPPRTIWDESSSRLPPSWANRRASRRRSRAGSPIATYRARFGGKRLRDPRPGQGHDLLEIDRSGERDANERAAAVGVAPPVAAALDDPPRSSPSSSTGAGMELGGPARAHDAAADRERRCARIHDARRADLPTTSTRSASSRPTRRPRAGAARRSPSRLRGGPRRGDADRGGASAGPSTSPSPATTTCSPPTSSAASDQIWIVDWEYAGMGDRYFDLANFAVNNELDAGRRAGRCSRPTSARPPRAARLATLRADAVHVGLPRGDVGRRPDAPSPTSTSTSTTTRPSTSTRMRETAARPELRRAGSRRRVALAALSCRTRPAA